MLFLISVFDITYFFNLRPGGGGLFDPPLWFFADSGKTAAPSAAKFCIPVPTSILHIVCKN